MRKLLCTAGLSLSLIIPMIAQANYKIAVVNVYSIFQQLPQWLTVVKQLEHEFKSRTIELQSIERDLQNKMQRLQRDGSTMKASERNSLEKSVMAQREIFSNKAYKFEQDNLHRQTEERDKILVLIQNAVKMVAMKEGYDIVIDSNAVAYINNIQDITADVLKQVN